jgi:preprotein translocase subunit SecG
MLTAIISLILLSSVVLILVVLAQNSKGGGLTSQFGGSGTSQLMGVKKTGDILEKMTWGLAILIMALSLSTKFFIDTTQSEASSPNIESAQDKAVVPNLDGLDSNTESLDDALKLEDSIAQ